VLGGRGRGSHRQDGGTDRQDREIPCYWATHPHLR